MFGDPLDYTDDEKRALTINLLGVTREVHAGDWGARPVDTATLCDLHRRVFGGVRDHAGKPRSGNWGSNYLTFGPNRSVKRHDVQIELENAFMRAGRCIRDAQTNPEAPDYDSAAIHIAVWLHAEIVRIHPFEDGNGRSSRLVMAHVLVILGLQPIPVEAVKHEYCAALNRFFRDKDIRPLRDLFLQLA